MTPLTPTTRGLAAALAASALEQIFEVPYRLHWYVDLDAHGFDGGTNPSEPPDLRLEELWTRFRGYLDRQTFPVYYGPTAQIALVLDYTVRSTRRRVRQTYNVSWSANVTQLVRGQPLPVGRWWLAPEPRRVLAPNGAPSHLCDGDIDAIGPWLAGVPF